MSEAMTEERLAEIRHVLKQTDGAFIFAIPAASQELLAEVDRLRADAYVVELRAEVDRLRAEQEKLLPDPEKMERSRAEIRAGRVKSTSDIRIGLAVAQENEACAKVADDYADGSGEDQAVAIAFDIRARRTQAPKE